MQNVDTIPVGSVIELTEAIEHHGIGEVGVIVDHFDDYYLIEFDPLDDDKSVRENYIGTAKRTQFTVLENSDSWK